MPHPLARAVAYNGVAYPSIRALQRAEGFGKTVAYRLLREGTIRRVTPAEAAALELAALRAAVQAAPTRTGRRRLLWAIWCYRVTFGEGAANA